MKSISKKLFIIIFSLIMFLLLFNLDVYAEEFSLEKESVDLWLNRFTTLWTKGGQGDKVWKSSDESVVTVDSEGKITGLKIGTATITVTRGDESDSCTVNVVYESIIIHGNGEQHNVNLLLNEHDSEQLYTIVKDGIGEEVSDAVVTWESSDKSIVTVDNTGKIKGLKPGKATITAKAAGVVDTCEVNVFNKPEHTDFSKAKYQLVNRGLGLIALEISETIKPEKKSDLYSLYYIITPDNVKPEIKTNKYGNIEQDNMEYLPTDEEKGNYYINSMNEYIELNQDMYIWVIETIKLNNYISDNMSYVDSNGELIQYTHKFVVEGQKIERTGMPLLDEIITNHHISESTFHISLDFPTEKNKKYTVKIGEVTDKGILQKIKNNDYSGIEELLSYSKKNTPVFTTKLELKDSKSFINNEYLIGKNVLKINAYYYFYVGVDTENGKYYPLEAINLYQAVKAYNSELQPEEYVLLNPKWESWDDSTEDDKTEEPDTNKPNDETKPNSDKPNNTTKPDTNKPSNTTKPDTNKPTDTTTSNKDIPHTGLANTIIYIAIIASIAGLAIGIIKYKKYQF